MGSPLTDDELVDVVNSKESFSLLRPSMGGPLNLYSGLALEEE